MVFNIYLLIIIRTSILNIIQGWEDFSRIEELTLEDAENKIINLLPTVKYARYIFKLIHTNSTNSIFFCNCSNRFKILP